MEKKESKCLSKAVMLSSVAMLRMGTVIAGSVDMFVGSDLVAWLALKHRSQQESTTTYLHIKNETIKLNPLLSAKGIKAKKSFGKGLCSMRIASASCRGSTIFSKRGKVYKVSSDTIVLAVPARGVGGASPKRDFIMELDASSDYELDSPNHVVESINYGGLEKVDESWSPVANRTGVRFRWELKNTRNFPVNGRTGTVEWSMRLKRRGDYEEALPQFSPTYMAIRAKFLERFFFEGLVANSWDHVPREGKETLTFADTLLNMGQALIAFTSEHQINQLHGRDGSGSAAIIKTILRTARFELMDQVHVGYFIRDNMEGPNDARLREFRNRVNIISDFSSSNGRDKEVSVDQYVGLMVALSMVHRYFGSFQDAVSREIVDHAYVLVKDSFEWMFNHDFTIRTPSNQPVSRGPDARGFCTLLHGIYKNIVNYDVFNRIPHAAQIAAVWDRGGLVSSVLRALGYAFNDYAVHMALMLVSPSEVWTLYQLERAWTPPHHLSILLNAWHHSNIDNPVAPTLTPWSDVSSLLGACSPSGPSSQERYWNHDNFWVRGATPGHPSAESVNVSYNGLDYLAFHNLSKLVYNKA